jgi:hypothetical protein
MDPEDANPTGPLLEGLLGATDGSIRDGSQLNQIRNAALREK